MINTKFTVVYTRLLCGLKNTQKKTLKEPESYVFVYRAEIKQL